MNLRDLALKYGSDKAGHHEYCDHYEQHFAHLRYKEIRLLELGIGGYAEANTGGASLKMWAGWFPNGKIYGVDLYDKSFLNSDRIKTFVADQEDENISNLIDGSLDIIIDDASHDCDRTVQSFENLFWKLSPGGLYCIEDVSSSWLAKYGGHSYLDRDSSSAVNLARELVNDIHDKGRALNGYPIASVHFYKDIIIIERRNLNLKYG